MQRRLHLGLTIGTLCVIFAFVGFNARPWKAQPMHLDGHEPERVSKPIIKSGSLDQDLDFLRNSTYCPIGWKDLYPTAEASFSRTLVVARLRNESTDWITDALDDLILPKGPIRTAIYTADDEEAPLHPVANKGHEANVYLSYIIDAYDNELPDISLFMHSHRFTWHNNDLLNADSALIVRNLSPGRVISEGFVNLRCHWDPGCPDWIHPSNAKDDSYKQEERIIASAWSEIFPGTAVPHTLAQPCCAQFAVSKARIQSLPKERYIALRDWIYNTQLSDYISGRVFEYLWQFIFTSQPKYCPAQDVCYCELYGVCFNSKDNKFKDWASRAKKRKETYEELSSIKDKAGDYLHKCQPLVAAGATEDVNCDERKTTLEHDLKSMDAEIDRRARLAFDAGRAKRKLIDESGDACPDF